MPGASFAAEGSATDGGLSGWSAASLGVVAFAFALRGLATPVTTCATDGQEPDYVLGYDQDINAMREYLETSFAAESRHPESQFYADADLPCDVEFSQVREPQVHEPQHQLNKEENPIHHAFGIVEDMFKSAIDSWKPTGFPFHHFPAAKKATEEIFGPAKKETQTP
jgi:hypothetical protein